jgi:hypothetical protein
MSPDINEKDLVRDTLNASRMVMTILEENFSNPMDAYVALVFTLASLSHGMGIDLEHTLAGVKSAHEDLAASRLVRKGPLQ